MDQPSEDIPMVNHEQVSSTSELSFEQQLENSVISIQNSLIDTLSLQATVNEAAHTGQVPYVPVFSFEDPKRPGRPIQLNLASDGWVDRALVPLAQVRHDNRDLLPNIPTELLEQLANLTHTQDRTQLLGELHSKLVEIQQKLDTYETSDDEGAQSPIKVFGSDYQSLPQKQ